MRQMTGIGSIQFDIRLNSVRWFLLVTSCNGTSTTLVWNGPSMVIDGPSLIDSCVSMKLSSTI